MIFSDLNEETQAKQRNNRGKRKQCCSIIDYSFGLSIWVFLERRRNNRKRKLPLPPLPLLPQRQRLLPRLPLPLSREVTCSRRRFCCWLME